MKRATKQIMSIRFDAIYGLVSSIEDRIGDLLFQIDFRYNREEILVKQQQIVGNIFNLQYVCRPSKDAKLLFMIYTLQNAWHVNSLPSYWFDAENLKILLACCNEIKTNAGEWVNVADKSNNPIF